MDDFKSICVLGRLPGLGIAELEALYGAEHIRPLSGAVLLDVLAENIDFRRLGGTMKTGRILAVLPSTDYSSAMSYLKNTLPKHLAGTKGKITLGVSFYGFGNVTAKVNKDLLSLKKTARQAGHSLRIVPNKAAELNSAQVLHNKLTRKGGWELIFITDGKQTILAQTLFVQDIEAYAARDHARPKRDARVGMLPPKLAQTLVNLATGQKKSPVASRQSPGTEDKRQETTRIRVLDPFCGTGVVLQEALLMGYSVIGTDIEPRMVEYSKENIGWLVAKYPSLEGQVAINVADATHYHWPRFSTIASEVFLGRPLTALPERQKLQTIVNDANTVIRKFLENLAPQLKSGQRVVLAVPAWRKTDGLIGLPLLDKLTDMGYNFMDFVNVPREDLVYFREGQVVARQILILERS